MFLQHDYRRWKVVLLQFIGLMQFVRSRQLLRTNDTATPRINDSFIGTHSKERKFSHSSHGPHISSVAGPGPEMRLLGVPLGGESISFFPLVQIVLDPRGVQDRSPSRHKLFPSCGFAEPILDAPGYCPLVRILERGADMNYESILRGFTTVKNMYETEKEPAQDDESSLPVRMADIGHPLPFQIKDQALIEKERQTAYWYYRNILNLYTYVKRCVQAGTATAKPPPYVPRGYHSQRLIFTSSNGEKDPPIGQSFVKGTHIVVVMRGTIFKTNLVQDETFEYANPSDSGVTASGLNGRLHKGFFSEALTLTQQIEMGLDAHPTVDLLSFAGHSLGAAYIQLVAPILALRRPDLAVEVWNFGAPPAGDTGFVEQYNALLNLRARSFMYIGNGLVTSASVPFGIGDIIPQALSLCWPVRGCPGTQNPDMNAAIKYEATGGIVAFYSTDMPNTEEWNRVDQVVTLDSSPSACHGCSYLCWSIQGLDDPENRCYFAEHPWPCPYTAWDGK